MSVIKVENLCKNYKVQDRNKNSSKSTVFTFFKRNYKTIQAVKDISFSIDKGEIVGYIGPNGAGKSTSIKLMCGILTPTSGRVELNGTRPYKNRKENAYNMGVVFGQRSQLWWDLPVRDSFQLLKGMYKITNKDYLKCLDTFNEIVNLHEFYDIPVRNLSLGQKMRAEICAAFLHNPSVVFLDEPTIGLDIVSKRNIQRFIVEINKQYKTTIVLTTHDLSDIEALCKRVILIDKGMKLFDGNIETLFELYGRQERLTVEFGKSIARWEDDELLTSFENVEIEEKKLTIQYDYTKVNHSEILKKLFMKYNVLDFSVQRTTLENIIHDLYLNKSY